MDSLAVVAIVGRPNVGKSSLFNRLLKRRRALVDSTPGLTRDRLYGDVEWRGVPFRVVDTAGFEVPSGRNRGPALHGIHAQVSRAMEEAVAALLVCDVQEGPTPMDRRVAQWLRRWGKPVLLAVNKADHAQAEWGVHEFSALGLGTPWAVSSLHGLGVGELLDALVLKLKETAGKPVHPPAHSPIRVAIIGRPNVGKSSLMNRLLNEERVLVDEAPGTTRDSVEAALRFGNQDYLLVDTAGLRARRKSQPGMDRVAQLKSLEAIQEADVCCGVLEASRGILRDDLRLLGAAIRLGKPLCIVLNKWDLVGGDCPPRQAADELYRRAPFLRFAPVLCISAKTGLRVIQALELIKRIFKRARSRMTKGQGKSFLEAIRRSPDVPAGIRHAGLIRIFQVGVDPPTFHLLARVNRPLRSSETAFLEGRLRRHLDLEGIPIRIRLLNKER